VQLNIVRIGSKPIVFELNVDETLPARLFGDELRVKQVLNNILSNAFKYTRQGSVKFGITWEENSAATTNADQQAAANEDSAKTVFIVFSVSDTGIGIKQENVGKLFAEYAQFDTKANRKIEGTGLGLSITKKLVEMMRGTITVTSEYGKGTVFTVRLLQKLTTNRQLGKQVVDNLKNFNYMQERHTRAQNLVRSYMPYGKVLVVDDVQTNLDVARGLLLPYGLTIDCVLSGKEAINRVRAGSVRYDAIFMDHMMPELDGIETTHIIRNEIDSDYAKIVPVIALTANALSGNEEMFLRNGFNAFISKPIDIMRLDVLLNQFIRDIQSKETLLNAEEELKKLKLLAPAAQPAETTNKNSGPLAGVSIDGIDMQAGVERYSDEEVFEGILKSYMQHTPGLLQKLKTLSPETLKDYAVTVHGLKSASYGIFANAIGKQAEELEALSKAGNYDEVNKRNENFVSDAQKIVDNISNMLMANVKVKNETKDVVDQKILADILEAAKHFKTIELEEAISQIEQFEYIKKEDAELVAWLREQADNLEYDAIRERLEQQKN
jgi:CheY-like chemotaxis protein